VVYVQGCPHDIGGGGSRLPSEMCFGVGNGDFGNGDCGSLRRWMLLQSIGDLNKGFIYDLLELRSTSGCLGAPRLPM